MGCGQFYSVACEAVGCAVHSLALAATKAVGLGSDPMAGRDAGATSNRLAGARRYGSLAHTRGYQTSLGLGEGLAEAGAEVAGEFEVAVAGDARLSGEGRGANGRGVAGLHDRGAFVELVEHGDVEHAGATGEGSVAHRGVEFAV